MTPQNQVSKAITLSMLIKADVANPNAGWGEGNITVMKKVSLNDGSRHPYISGQALRRYLRDTLVGQGIVPNEKMSPQNPGADPKAPILTDGKPTKYIDDDIFGFMGAVKEATRRRESPLRVSAAFGLFSYQGDRDLGTRSKLDVTKDPEEGGAMFETEITNNVFRTTWLVELDRIGCGWNYETTDTLDDLKKEKVQISNIEKKKKKKGSANVEYDIFFFSIDDQERKKRVVNVLEALKYYRGGARCGRLLLDLIPRFIVYFRLTKKLPLLLNDLEVVLENKEYKLKEESIKEIVNDYREDIQSCIVGYRKGFLPLDANSLKAIFEVKREDKGSYFPVTVCSVGEAIDMMISDIKQETVKF